MAQDAAWLAHLSPNDLPILHFYDWARPSVTVGHFIDVNKFFNRDGVVKHNLAIARRPTGGGIVFHIWDLAFSLLVPAGHPGFSANTLDNYRWVNEVVLDVAKTYFSLDDPLLIQQSGLEMGTLCNHFCMARPTIYDAVYRGLKVAGAAQRKTKQGFLHQGTISLAFPQIGLLQDVLLSNEDVIKAMQLVTFAPLGVFDPNRLKRVRLDLKQMLCRKFLDKIKKMNL